MKRIHLAGIAVFITMNCTAQHLKKVSPETDSLTIVTPSRKVLKKAVAVKKLDSTLLSLPSGKYFIQEWREGKLYECPIELVETTKIDAI